jgi:hypothetical protein
MSRRLNLRDRSYSDTPDLPSLRVELLEEVVAINAGEVAREVVGLSHSESPKLPALAENSVGV